MTDALGVEPGCLPLPVEVGFSRKLCALPEKKLMLLSPVLH